jgi:hypothetical protein
LRCANHQFSALSAAGPNSRRLVGSFSRGTGNSNGQRRERRPPQEDARISAA